MLNKVRIADHTSAMGDAGVNAVLQQIHSHLGPHFAESVFYKYENNDIVLQENIDNDTIQIYYKDENGRYVVSCGKASAGAAEYKIYINAYARDDGFVPTKNTNNSSGTSNANYIVIDVGAYGDILYDESRFVIAINSREVFAIIFDDVSISVCSATGTGGSAPFTLNATFIGDIARSVYNIGVTTSSSTRPKNGIAVLVPVVTYFNQLAKIVKNIFWTPMNLFTSPYEGEIIFNEKKYLIYGAIALNEEVEQEVDENV